MTAVELRVHLVDSNSAGHLADYQVCFTFYGAEGEAGYLDQCCNNQSSLDFSTPVTVTAGTTRAGTNAVLSAAP